MIAQMMTCREADSLPDAGVGIFALWQLTQMSPVYRKVPCGIPHFLEKYGYILYSYILRRIIFSVSQLSPKDISPWPSPSCS